MSNNILYVFNGSYGTPTAGVITPLVQGQYGQSVPLEIRDPTGAVVNLTGYSTITGHRQKDSYTVYPLTGTLTLSVTPSAAPQITWVPSEADTSVYGAFSLWLEITNGSIVYRTDPVPLFVVRDPDVNATASPGYVGVSTTARTLLNSLVTLTGLANFDGAGAATAIKIKLNGTAAPAVNDDSGDGYGIGSLWVDTTNDNAYIATDVTVGAANWEQINGAGGSSAWGGITGTLADQTDLQTALNGKLATTAVTGGGVLATGGFTLTVPATGTAALLATANVFTAAQQTSITSSGATGMTVTNSGAATDTIGVRGSAPTGIGLQGLTNSGIPLNGFTQAATSTSAVTVGLKLMSRASGTPGAGFGQSIVWQLETSTTNDTDAGRIAVLWNTATHASRMPDGVFYLTDSGAEREIWRGRANGSAAAIGFLGATPAAQQSHINDPSGGAIIDAEARTAINSVLDILQTFGLMAA